MTLDTDTGRVIASTTEQAEVYAVVRRAMAMLMSKFPGVFTIQMHSVAWTSGDTRYALPAAVRRPLWVTYAGKNLRPLTRIKRQDLVKGDAAGGGWKITGITGYYHMVGISNEGTADSPDYRQVIELIPTPTTPYDAQTLIVAYNAKAWALPRDNATDGAKEIPLDEAMQEWLLRRAQIIYGADASDPTTVQTAREELLTIEMDIDQMVQDTLEYPEAAMPEFPTLPDASRDEMT